MERTRSRHRPKRRRRYSRSSTRRPREGPKKKTVEEESDKGKKKPVTQGVTTKGLEDSLKKMEERMETQFKLMTAQLQKTTGTTGTTLQRQQFMAAALRLPEGDPLRDIALRDYALTTSTSGTDIQQR